MRLIEFITEKQASLKNEIDSFPFMSTNYVYNSSTLDFQNKSGIQVTQTYRMPDGLSTEEVYRYYSSLHRALDSRKIKSKEYRERIAFLQESIFSINPDLRKIVNSADVENAEGHVITAALSRFNIDDIKAYVVDGKTGRWYMNQPGWDTRHKMEQEIETLTGAPIYWVVSDPTLKKIYLEVSKKYKNKKNTKNH